MNIASRYTLIKNQNLYQRINKDRVARYIFPIPAGGPIFSGNIFRSMPEKVITYIFWFVLPHRSRVPLGRGDQLELFQVPEVDCPVLGGRGQEELVRVELDIVDGPAVLRELGHQLSGSKVPDLKEEKL